MGDLPIGKEPLLICAPVPLNVAWCIARLVGQLLSAPPIFGMGALPIGKEPLLICAEVPLNVAWFIARLVGQILDRLHGGVDGNMLIYQLHQYSGWVTCRSGRNPC